MEKIAEPRQERFKSLRQYLKIIFEKGDGNKLGTVKDEYQELDVEVSKLHQESEENMKQYKLLLGNVYKTFKRLTEE